MSLATTRRVPIMRPRTRSRRYLSLLLVVLTILAGSTSALAQGNGPDGFSAKPLSPASRFESSSAKLLQMDPQGGAANGNLVSVIVKLDAAPLATYRGDVPGFAATSPQVTG